MTLELLVLLFSSASFEIVHRQDDKIFPGNDININLKGICYKEYALVVGSLYGSTTHLNFKEVQVYGVYGEETLLDKMPPYAYEMFKDGQYLEGKYTGTSTLDGIYFGDWFQVTYPTCYKMEE